MQAKVNAGHPGMGTRLVSKPVTPLGKSRVVQLSIALIITALVASLVGWSMRASADETGPNLIVNGSFELPVTESTGAVIPEAPAHWTRDQGGTTMIWRSTDHAPDGDQFIQLYTPDAERSFYQDISTIPGQSYELTFSYSPYPLSPESGNEMQVRWGDDVVRTLAEDGLLWNVPGEGQVDFLEHLDWNEYVVLLNATGETTRLTFRATGTGNFHGVLLDDVQVVSLTVVASCSSAGSGDWNDPDTWDCGGEFGVPGEGTDVVIQDGDTVTLTQDESASNLTIEDGGTLDNSGGYTLNVYGDWIQDGDYVSSSLGDDTVVFTGSQDQMVSGFGTKSFGNVKVDKQESDQTVTIDSTMLSIANSFQTALGTTTITSTRLSQSTESAGTDTVQLLSSDTSEDEVFLGKVIIEDGGVLEIEDDDESLIKITVEDDWENDGEFRPSKSTVVFEGSKLQNLKGDSTTQFNNLEINKTTNILDVASRIQVAAKSDFTAGLTRVGTADFNDVLIKDGATLRGTANTTKTFTGNLQIDGDYEANESKVLFMGSNDQQISGLKSKTFYDLEVNKDEPDQTVTIHSNLLSIANSIQTSLGTTTITSTRLDHQSQDNSTVQLLSSHPDEDEVLLNKVIIEEGGTLEIEDDDERLIKVRVEDDWENNGEFKPSRSTVVFEGSKLQNLKGNTTTQFNNFEVNKLENALNIASSIQVQSTTTLRSGSSRVGNADFQGDVEIMSGAALIGEAISTKLFSGNLIIDGSYTHNDSTDRFVGDNPLQKISGTSLATFSNLELDKENPDDRLDVESSLLVEHSLHLIKGTLASKSTFGDVIIEEEATLIADDEDDEIFVKGNWTSDGEFEAGDGTVVFSGTEQQSIGGTKQSTFNNLKIENDTALNTTVKIDGTLTLSANLTLGEGVTIEQGENFDLVILDGGELESSDPVSLGPIEVTPDALIAIGTELQFSAEFTNLGWSDSHKATWDWGDGTLSTVKDEGIEFALGSGTVKAMNSYDTPGVYTVTLTLTPSKDPDRSATAVYQFLVVYDPAGGFVTGGGWIDSPAGAYAPDPDLTGKASFGFVSRYQRGANVPTGNTQFEFKAGSLEFKSTEYEWLVIAGPSARFKGSGTINGEGDYGFMLVGVDGSINGSGGENKFRIRIWDKSDGDAMVYDNQHGASEDSDDATVLGGGNIQIHQPQGGGNGGGRGNN